MNESIAIYISKFSWAKICGFVMISGLLKIIYELIIFFIMPVAGCQQLNDCKS